MTELEARSELPGTTTRRRIAALVASGKLRLVMAGTKKYYVPA